MSPQITDYPRYAWQLLAGSRSNGERDMAERRRNDIAAYLDMSLPLRVLDVANGRLRPQYTILKSEGHRAYGFDLATSVAAFEHFLDVPAVVTELHRVLRPGGVVWVCVHLFTSPTGGHNLS